MHTYAMGIDLGLGSLGGGRSGKVKAMKRKHSGKTQLCYKTTHCAHILLLDRAVQINFVSDFFSFPNHHSSNVCPL